MRCTAFYDTQLKSLHERSELVDRVSVRRESCGPLMNHVVT